MGRGVLIGGEVGSLPSRWLCRFAADNLYHHRTNVAAGIGPCRREFTIPGSTEPRLSSTERRRPVRRGRSATGPSSPAAAGSWTSGYAAVPDRTGAPTPPRSGRSVVCWLQPAAISVADCAASLRRRAASVRCPGDTGALRWPPRRGDGTTAWRVRRPCSAVGRTALSADS